MRIWSKRPRAVFDEAHRFSPEVRPDWLKVRIEMVRGGCCAVTWHPSLMPMMFYTDGFGTMA